LASKNGLALLTTKTVAPPNLGLTGERSPFSLLLE
jgi:hypothetical protein